jgi:hypothetical protein
MAEPFLGEDWVKHARPAGQLPPHFRDARILLVPAIRVTGLKPTVPRAWTTRRPVVAFRRTATSLGQSGASAIAGEPSRYVSVLKECRWLDDRLSGPGVLRAPANPLAIAEGVIRLLRDGDLRHAQSEARALWASTFSTVVRNQALLKHYHSALALAG